MTDDFNSRLETDDTIAVDDDDIDEDYNVNFDVKTLPCNENTCIKDTCDFVSRFPKGKLCSMGSNASITIYKNIFDELESHLRNKFGNDEYALRCSIHSHMNTVLNLSDASIEDLALDLVEFAISKEAPCFYTYHFLRMFLCDMCWWYRYDDGDTIQTLLGQFQRFCGGTFHCLFDIKCHAAGPSIGQFDRTRPEPSRLEYILSKTTNMIILDDDGELKRFVDAPIEGNNYSKQTPFALAADYGDYHAVLTLLRYGADVQFSCPSDPDRSRVTTYLTSLFEKLSYIKTNTTQLQSTSDATDLVKCYHKCILHIMEAVPKFNVDKDVLTELLDDNDRELIITRERLEQPVDLAHMCKCTIRQELYNNMELPHGIYELPLPRSLKLYIDLLSEEEEDIFYDCITSRSDTDKPSCSCNHNHMDVCERIIYSTLT